MTPTVQGKTLVYRQDGQEQVLIVDTAAWFAWTVMETYAKLMYRKRKT